MSRRPVFLVLSSVKNVSARFLFCKSWDTGPVPPEGGSRVSRRPAFLGVASIITVSARFFFCASWKFPLVPHRMESVYRRAQFSLGARICFNSDVCTKCRKPHNKKRRSFLSFKPGDFLRLSPDGLGPPAHSFFSWVFGKHSDVS